MGSGGGPSVGSAGAVDWIEANVPPRTTVYFDAAGALKRLLPTEAASAPAAARSTATNPTSPVNHPALVLMPSPETLPDSSIWNSRDLGTDGLGCK